MLSAAHLRVAPAVNLKLDGLPMMTSKSTHVVAAFWIEAVLLLLVACAVHGAVEAPESVHRRSFFQLDTKRLSQAMWLDGAVNHGVPSRFPCSSLEGASCLYNAPLRSRFAEGALAPLPLCLLVFECTANEL